MADEFDLSDEDTPEPGGFDAPLYYQTPAGSKAPGLAYAPAKKKRKLPDFNVPDFDPQAAAEAFLAPDPAEQHDRAKYYAERGFEPVTDAVGRVVPRGTKFNDNGRADLEHLTQMDEQVDLAPKTADLMKVMRYQAAQTLAAQKRAAADQKKTDAINERLRKQELDAPNVIYRQVHADAAQHSAELSRFHGSPGGKELKGYEKEFPDDAETAKATLSPFSAAFDFSRQTGDLTPEAEEAQVRLARMADLRQRRDRLEKLKADSAGRLQKLDDERNGVAADPTPTTGLAGSTRPDVQLAQSPSVSPEGLVRMKNRAADLQTTLDEGAGNLAAPVRVRLRAQIDALNKGFDAGLSKQSPDVQRRIADQTRDPTLGEKIESAAGNAAGAAAESLLDVPQFADRQITRLENAVGIQGGNQNPDTAGGQDFINKMREVAQSWGPDVPDAVRKKLADSLVTHDLPRGVGAVAGMVAPGKLVAKLGATAEAAANLGMGGAATSNKMRSEALADGATPNQAGAAEATGAALGTSLAAAKPLGDFVAKLFRSGAPGRLFGATFTNKLANEGPEAAARFIDGAGKPLLQKAISAIGEGAGFGLQQAGQTVGENAAARGIGYDENRPLLRGADTAGASGFLLGAFTRALHESFPAKGGEAQPPADAQPTEPTPTEPIVPRPTDSELKTIGAADTAEALRKDAGATREDVAGVEDPTPESLAADAEQGGKAAKVEELLGLGYTPAQVAAEAGTDLATVHAVRTARNIPTPDDPAAFEAWREARPEPTVSNEPAAPEVVPQVQAPEESVAPSTEAVGTEASGRRAADEVLTPPSEPVAIGERDPTVSGKAVEPSRTRSGKKFYRETSAQNALDFIDKETSSDLGQRDVFLADAPELALGQGGNKGVMLEFHADDLQTRANRSKPGTEFAQSVGQPVERIGINSQEQYQKSLSAFTYDPQQIKSAFGIRLRRIAARLEKEGWKKTTESDGRVRLERPEDAPPVQPVEIGARDETVSDGSGTPTEKEQAMLTEQQRLVDEHLARTSAPDAPEIPATPDALGETPSRSALSEGQQGTSEENVGLTTKKGKRISVGTPAHGIDDILNEIEAQGGVSSKRNAREAANGGGEYDDIGPTFTGVSRLLLRGKNGGVAPDELASILHRKGLIADGNVSTMLDAVGKAIKAREVAKKASKNDEYHARFERAFIGNEHPRKWLRSGKQISVDDLNAGDVFHVDGEKFTVKEVDENGNVTIQDGIKKVVGPGTPVSPDGGKVMRGRKAVEFPDRPAESPAVEPPAPAEPEPPAAPPAAESAATPEATPPEGTGIKNASVEDMRAKMGKAPAAPREGTPTKDMHAEAIARVEADLDAGAKLVRELAESDRQATGAESVLISHELTRLDNARDAVEADLERAVKSGDEAAEIRALADRAAIEAQFDQTAAVADAVGTKWSDTGRARQAVLKKDFSIANLTRRQRIINRGEEPTKVQRERIKSEHDDYERTLKDLNDAIAERDRKLSESAGREAEKDAQIALMKIGNDLAQERRAPPKARKAVLDSMIERGDAARDRLLAKMRSGQVRSSITLGLEDAKEYAQVIAGYIAKGIRASADLSARLIKDFGDGIRPHIAQLVKLGAEEHARTFAALRDTGRDTVSERQQTVDALKARVTAGQPLTAQGGLVRQLIDQHLADGVKFRDGLTDAVHETLKQVDPTITRSDTISAIKDAERTGAALKHVESQINQLSAELRTETVFGQGKPRPIHSTELTAKRAELAALKEQRDYMRERLQPTDHAAKDVARIERATNALKEKLARQDFSKRPKRPEPTDKEVLEAKTRHEIVKDRILAGQRALELANRTKLQKFGDNVKEALNLPRSVLSSWDLSAVLRQGGFISIGNPARAAKSIVPMLRSLRNDFQAKKVDTEIRSRENAPLYKKSGLYLAPMEAEAPLSSQEEQIMSKLARNIPGVRASNRAFVTYLNKLRADSFDQMKDALIAKGKEPTKEELAAISNYINVSTGRGALGVKTAAAAEALASVFFSPRLAASRFQLLAGQPLYKGTAQTRAMVAKEYAKFLVGASAIYGLGALAGATIEHDPRSSDFGKLRWGNTRLDPLAGMSQVAAFLSKLISGSKKNAAGKIVPLRDSNRFPELARDPKTGKPQAVGYGAQDETDVIKGFVRSKLSPVVGAGVDLVTGKDFAGQPTTPGQIAANLVTPLPFSGASDVIKEHGAGAAPLEMLNLLGMGLQNYQPPKKKPAK